MNPSRKIAIIVGILILAAYSIIGSGNPEAKTLSMVLEVFSGLAVIAIAVLMFPIFKPYNQNVTYGYLIFRIIEGGLLVVTGILYFVHSARSLELHTSIHGIHGYIFAVAALIFYFLLDQSKLVPRWLSLWGVIGAILLVAVSALEGAGVIPQLIIMRLPIILNELVLAIWLIAKGFNKAETASEIE